MKATKTVFLSNCGMRLAALTVLRLLACAPPDLNGGGIQAADLPLPPRSSEDAGLPDGVAVTDSALAGPVYGLLDAYESADPKITSLTANTGFAIAHSIDVDVEPDDVLRVFGQVEVTNDFVRPVNVTLRARVDGALVIGNQPTENAVATGSHHMPLWVDAIDSAPTKGRRKITLEVAAARGDAAPAVIIEKGYGHLVVEHYRRFNHATELASAGARGVFTISSDHKARTLMFGGSFTDRALPFTTNTDVRGGDIVRIHGTSTSRTGPLGEMHGLGLFINTQKRIGPWATKNGVADSPDVPLIVDAIDRPVADGSLAYNLSMHGVFNRGGAIVDGGGGLDALVFRKPTSGGGTTIPSFRAPSKFVSAAAVSFVDVVANAASPTEVIKASLGHFAAETPIRIAVNVNAVPTTAGFTIPIGCTLRVTIDGDSSTAKPPVIHQLITPLMASSALALRTVLTAPANSEGALRATVSCARDGANPVVKMLGAAVIAEPLVVAQ